MGVNLTHILPPPTQRIDPSGKLLEHYTKRGFTMANDSGHKKYTKYYKNQRMRDVVASYYASDMKLGYCFDTDGEFIKPARYQDGKVRACSS